MSAEKIAAEIRACGVGNIHNDTLLECLDKLAQIEAAALPANVDAIRREHASVDYAQGLSGSEANEAHRNRGVLLEIVRLQVLLIAGMKRQVDEADRRLKLAFENERRLQQRLDEKRTEERAIKAERDRLRSDAENHRIMMTQQEKDELDILRHLLANCESRPITKAVAERLIELERKDVAAHRNVKPPPLDMVLVQDGTHDH